MSNVVLTGGDITASASIVNFKKRASPPERLFHLLKVCILTCKLQKFSDSQYFMKRVFFPKDTPSTDVIPADGFTKSFDSIKPRTERDFL